MIEDRVKILTEEVVEQLATVFIGVVAVFGLGGKAGVDVSVVKFPV